jgi:hypothetical protein
MKRQEKPEQAAPAVNQTLILEIGNVNFALRCLDGDVYKRLKRFYGAFLTGSPADITVELSGTDRFKSDDLSAALADNDYIHEQNHFRSTSEVVAGQYDLDCGFIRLTGEKGLVNPDRKCNILNQLLAMSYYSACKVKYGGPPPAMLVHACGIIRSGKAIIFAGPSEAGKTTIASLCGRRQGNVINDEMLLVSRPGQNGDGISVRSAPFLGKFTSRRAVTAPLRCILMLKKSTKTLLRCLDRTEAYTRFIRQIITPAYIGQINKRAVLSLMAEFSDIVTRAIPVYELEFNLDKKSLWQTVGGLEK